MGLLIKGIGGPLNGQVIVESLDGRASPEVIVPTKDDAGKVNYKVGVYGLVFLVPPGEGPMALGYQWKGSVRL